MKTIELTQDEFDLIGRVFEIFLDLVSDTDFPDLWLIRGKVLQANAVQIEPIGINLHEDNIIVAAQDKPVLAGINKKFME